MKIKIRRATSSEWLAANPVLDAGEIGADLTLNRIKIGNGVSPWAELEFSDKRKRYGVGFENASVATGIVGSVQHGLGKVPDGIEWWFWCWQATNGYAVGDVLYTVQTGQPNIYADDVGLSVILPATTTLLTKGTQTSATLTRARWRLYARPFINV